MTIILRAAVPLVVLLAAPVLPLEAQESPDIQVVAPNAEVRAWSERVAQRIERQMLYPATLAGNIPGIVDVTFMCSDEGRPTQVAVARSSGYRPIDRAGLKAVRSVHSLHPLPAGVGHEKRYKARLFFATDDASGRWAQDRVALRERDDGRANAPMGQRHGLAAVAVTVVPAALP